MYQMLYSFKNPLVTLFTIFQVISTLKVISYIELLDIQSRHFSSKMEILKMTSSRSLHISTNIFQGLDSCFNLTSLTTVTSISYLSITNKISITL